MFRSTSDGLHQSTSKLVNGDMQKTEDDRKRLKRLIQSEDDPKAVGSDAYRKAKEVEGLDSGDGLDGGGDGKGHESHDENKFCLAIRSGDKDTVEHFLNMEWPSIMEKGFFAQLTFERSVLSFSLLTFLDTFNNETPD